MKHPLILLNTLMAACAMTVAATADNVPSSSARAAEVESSAATYIPVLTDQVEHACEMAKKPLSAQDNQFICYGLYHGEAAYRVGKATGNQESIDTGLKLYDMVLELPDFSKHVADFHVAISWGRFTDALHRDGLLTGARREKVQGLAAATLQAYAGTAKARGEVWICDNNFSMGPLLTYSAMAKAFPDDPNAAATKDKLRAILDLQIAQGDVREESTNYEPLLIGVYLDLLRQENRLNDLTKNPRFRRMIERWRDFTSPGVFSAEFADDFFSHWGINFGLVAILEQAARVFNDPTMATEARRLMQGYVPGNKTAGDRLRAIALLDLQPYRFVPTPLPALSVVHKRGTGSGPKEEVWNTLVLRTGHKPGDATIMMDLYSAAQHGHSARRPAIGYYEACGMPLFHNLGRQSVKSGPSGNVFWNEEQPDSFPGLARPGIWNTQTISLVFREPVGDDRSISGHIWFCMLGSKREDTQVSFANMRLEGPAGTKVIDDFSDRSRWRNFEGTEFHTDHPDWIETLKDPVKGSFQKLLWGQMNRQSKQSLVRTLGTGPEGTIRFKAGEFDTVKFDYKYEGELPHVRLDGWYGKGADLGFAELPCTVADAQVRQLGNDAWGRVDFTSYRGTGNELSRRMLLTKEGALIIVDRYQPGSRSDKETVGQLWQLHTLIEKGDDWFAAASDGLFPQADGVTRPERRMLVKYHRVDGTTCSASETTPNELRPYRIENGKPVFHKSFWTTYSKSTLSGDGKPFTTVQVVHPLLKDADAAKAAAAIQFTEVGDGTAKLRLPTDDNGIVEVTIHGDGATATRKAN